MLSEVTFTNYFDSVKQALIEIGAEKTLENEQKIMLKPNLVQATPPPVTTPVECTGAIIDIIREFNPSAEIVIAEGCGAANYDTEKAFDELGYSKLAEKSGVKLFNLNTCKLKKLSNPSCKVFPEFYIPEIAFDYFIISIPVLKAHSLAEITGTLKNMMGFAPPSHYQQGGHWKKSAFHSDMQQSIIDLNQYRTPDLTIMDATVGLAEFHLGGAECKPHVNKILASFDAKKVDRRAAGILGFDWGKIEHLL